ncbi:DoxX family protein [Bacteroidota bacterium]
MKQLTKAGKYIYAIPLIIFGVFHFMNASTMADFMLKEWPLATILVYLTGLALVLAGVSILINVQTKLAVLLLALLFLIFIIGIHIPNMASGNEMSMSQMLKDLGLLGGALMIAQTYEN